MEFDLTGLSEYEISEIRRLLAKSPNDPPQLEDIWRMMDEVWDSLGCDNRNPNWDKIEEFYKHPVWILNGFFIEQHPLSMHHRNAVAAWIAQNNISSILDYGGGFGTSARLIAERDQGIEIDIYEPYPSKVAVLKAEAYPNIDSVSSLGKKYDCAISMDVFEHAPDPLKLFAEVIETVNIGGF